MMWLAVGAGVLAVWVGLGLYCAEAFMHRGEARLRTNRSVAEREALTPIPRARVAD